MENNKNGAKFAAVILIILSIISIAAAVVIEVTLMKGLDFISVLPILEMGTDQILFINFLVVYAVITLISIIVTMLVKDSSFGFGDVFAACPKLLLVIPLLLFGSSIYTTLGASTVIEHIICLAISAGFLLSCWINFGCVATLLEEE